MFELGSYTTSLFADLLMYGSKKCLGRFNFAHMLITQLFQLSVLHIYLYPYNKNKSRCQAINEMSLTFIFLRHALLEETV